MIWKTTRLVEFQHCDPAGIVFYPRYVEMVNSVVEEFFRDALDYAFGPMHAVDHKGVPTARISLEFQEPGFLEDPLVFKLMVARLGKSALDLEIACTSRGAPRFTAQSTLVQVDMATRKSTPWPDKMRRVIEGASK